MALCLGKKPARLGAVKLKFGKYFDADGLPTVPVVLGKPWLVPEWGMLGNDQAGCCVWSDAAHQAMLWTAEAGSRATFTTDNVLADYAAETQKDDPPGYPTVDGGTDMAHAAAYRSRVGVMDATGKRHTVGPYVALEPGNVPQLMMATYLFGAVSIGVELPSSAFDQFNMSEPWTVVEGSKKEGGHCISIVGRNSKGLILGVSWGRLIAIAPSWIVRYMDEGIAYVSFERLRNNVSPQGYDKNTLLADLEKLKGDGDLSDKAPIDSGKIAAAKTAIAAYIKPRIPWWAANYVTDQEETDLAAAVLRAVQDYENTHTKGV
jgi:hypothetical protein